VVSARGAKKTANAITAKTTACCAMAPKKAIAA
jgi:hypothetical protein